LLGSTRGSIPLIIGAVQQAGKLRTLDLSAGPLGADKLEPCLKETRIADFNGKDYPVIGLPLADAAACERLDNHTITITAKKQGNVVVTERLTVSQDGKTLTASFGNFTGVAVFDKH
jgi:hypothetical protein